MRLSCESQEILRGGFTFLYFLGLVPDFTSESSFQQFENCAKIDEGPFLAIAEPYSRPFHDFRVTREVYRLVDEFFFDDTFSAPGTIVAQDWMDQKNHPLTFHDCRSFQYYFSMRAQTDRQTSLLF